MKKINIKGIDEVIYYDECKNGLQVYMWPNKKSNSYYATLSIKYGSVYNDFKIGNKEFHQVPGIAHYLEHLKFNEKKGVTAHDYFNKLGSDTNAFTTFNYTNYQVFSSTNEIENITHLIEFVNNNYFTKELVDKERNIITEEAKMGKDDPFTVILFKHLNNIFNNYSQKYYITGDEEEISKITLDDIKLVFENYYKPSNMFLVITGNFDYIKVLDKIKEISNNKKDNKIPKRIILEEEDKVNVEYEEASLNINSNRLRYGIKINKNIFKKFDDMHIKIYTDILLNSLFGSTSDLKDKLLRKELISNINYSNEIFDDYLLIIISIDTDYQKEIINILDNTLKDIKISEEVFNRKKKALIANLILDYEDIEVVNSIIQQEVLLYNKINDNIKDIYEKLNYQDLLKFIKLFNIDNKSVLVLKPNKNDDM